MAFGPKAWGVTWREAPQRRATSLELCGRQAEGHFILPPKPARLLLAKPTIDRKSFGLSTLLQVLPSFTADPTSLAVVGPGEAILNYPIELDILTLL